MNWLHSLSQIEDLEDAEFDADLVAEFERRADRVVSRPIRFSTPTFKEYETSELEGCGKNSFPAFSITAGECGLNCDHCQKKILEPMIPATNPAMLEEKVTALSLPVETAVDVNRVSHELARSAALILREPEEEEEKERYTRSQLRSFQYDLKESMRLTLLQVRPPPLV